MKEIQDLIASINLAYLVLAYTGMLVHTLFKFGPIDEHPILHLSEHFKKRFYVIIATILSIPVLMIILSNEYLQTLFPLNYATSIILGAQAQSIFKKVMPVFTAKLNKEVADEAPDQNLPDDNQDIGANNPPV
jgi:accessory gene regulator protein AgrB